MNQMLFQMESNIYIQNSLPLHWTTRNTVGYNHHYITGILWKGTIPTNCPHTRKQNAKTQGYPDEHSKWSSIKIGIILVAKNFV